MRSRGIDDPDRMQLPFFADRLQPGGLNHPQLGKTASVQQRGKHIGPAGAAQFEGADFIDHQQIRAGATGQSQGPAAGGKPFGMECIGETVRTAIPYQIGQRRAPSVAQIDQGETAAPMVLPVPLGQDAGRLAP